jgi:iron complex transport system substrate-binding protein
LGAAPAAATSVVDDAGRRVVVTATIDRVYAAGPPASVLVYALAPGKLVGWTRSLSPEEAAFLPGRYADLPELGRLTGRGNTANVEVVLKTRPDLIVDSGSVAPTFASLADRVQEQTGLPYLLLDGRFERLAHTLRTLGRLIAEPDRTELLAGYVERTLGDAKARVDRVPVKDRPRVYYARGPNGLQSAPAGSINVETLEFLGARNVVDVTATRGLVNVSLEQVLSWNPDVIVTVDPNFYAAVWKDPRWASVKAVQNRRVHLSPMLPFGWVDFPPGLNRVIGVRWLGAVLYPDAFPSDLRAETRDFFRMFYHTDLTEAQLDQLLGPAKPR